jgi:predicted DCC family thiol-disulfide oxidoreductase YuxK
MSDAWRIEVFYDGDCPLCLKEINLLRWMDRKDRVRFTDIADPDFKPESIGRSFEDVMRRIHGRLPDGSVIEGADVFRHLYSAVGLGALVFFTRLPLLKQLCNFGYHLFAKYRLKVTGRCLDEACELRAQKTASKATA